MRIKRNRVEGRSGKRTEREDKDEKEEESHKLKT